MKCFSKFVVAFLIAAVAVMFVSCGKKTYSADEIGAQFKNELTGTWAMKGTITDPGGTETDINTIEVKGTDDVADFVKELKTVQEWFGFLEVSGEEYKLSGVNAFTYEKGKIKFNASATAALGGESVSVAVDFVAINMDFIEVKSKETYSAEEIATNFKDDLKGHWAWRTVTKKGEDGWNSTRTDEWTVEDDSDIEWFVTYCLKKVQEDEELSWAFYHEGVEGYNLTGVNSFCYEKGKIALKAGATYVIGSDTVSVDVDFLAINMDLIDSKK